MDALEPGDVVWAELRSPDHVAALPFYAELFGWDTGEAGAPFAFLRRGGADVGAAYSTPAGPHGWLPYVGVADAAQAVGKAEAAGATVVAPPRQVGEAGWSATIADAEGVELGVWQPAAHPGFGVRGGPGSFCRAELHTHRPADAGRALGAAFGWVESPGPAATYSWLGVPGRAAAGLVTISERDRPPGWLLFFGVDDVPAAIARAVALGGRLVHGPVSHSTLGDFAVLADTQGWVFGVVGVG